MRAAIAAIGDDLEARENAGFRFTKEELEVVAFLRDVALEHRDVLSRMTAISALARLENPESDAIFLKAIEDEHFAVRWEAAKALVAHPNPAATEVLARRLFEETNPDVRSDMIRALIAAGDRKALRALLQAFLDPDRRFQDNALKIYDGLKKLSGKDYPLVDSSSWQKYLDEELAADAPSDGSLPAEPTPAARALEPPD